MADAKKENKVQFDLKKVHYAMITGLDDIVTFGVPVPVKGAVSIALDPEGDTTTFYADGVAYYTSTNNGGYSGEMEIAYVPPQMRKDIWGIEEDTTSKVLIETNKAKTKDVALLFEIDGDELATKNCFYCCTLGRPKWGSDTATESKEPGTTSIPITAIPLPNGDIMATTQASTTPEAVQNWYKAVHQRTSVTQKSMEVSTA